MINFPDAGIQRLDRDSWMGSMDLAISPDGRLALSTCCDAIDVWDLELGQVRCQAKGKGKLALSSVGRGISYEGDVLKLWNLTDGSEVATINGEHICELATAVAMTGDGRWAVSVSYQAVVRLWNLESRKLLATFHGDHAFHSCAIAPDGKTVVAGDMMGNLHLLRLVESREEAESRAFQTRRNLSYLQILPHRREAETSTESQLDDALLVQWVQWKISVAEDDLQCQQARCDQLQELHTALQYSVFSKHAVPQPGSSHDAEMLQEIAEQLAPLQILVVRLKARVALLQKSETGLFRKQLLDLRQARFGTQLTFETVIQGKIIAAEQAAERDFRATQVNFPRLAAILAAGFLYLCATAMYWLFFYVPWLGELRSGTFPRTVTWIYRFHSGLTLAILFLVIPLMFFLAKALCQFFRNDPALKAASEISRGLVAGFAICYILTSLVILLSVVSYGWWALPVVYSGIVSGPLGYPGRLVPEQGSLIITTLWWMGLFQGPKSVRLCAQYVNSK